MTLFMYKYLQEYRLPPLGIDRKGRARSPLLLFWCTQHWCGDDPERSWLDYTLQVGVIIGVRRPLIIILTIIV